MSDNFIAQIYGKFNELIKLDFIIRQFFIPGMRVEFFSWLQFELSRLQVAANKKQIDILEN